TLVAGQINMVCYIEKSGDLVANNQDLTYRYNINSSALTAAGDSSETSPGFSANAQTILDFPVAGDIFNNGTTAISAGDVLYINLRRNGAAGDDPNNSSLYLTGIRVEYPADM